MNADAERCKVSLPLLIFVLQVESKEAIQLKTQAAGNVGKLVTATVLIECIVLLIRCNQPGGKLSEKS